MRELNESEQAALEAAWQKNFSDEPELSLYDSVAAGFIAGLEYQQAPRFSYNENGNITCNGEAYQYSSLGTSNEGQRRAAQFAEWLNERVGGKQADLVEALRMVYDRVGIGGVVYFTGAELAQIEAAMAEVQAVGGG